MISVASNTSLVDDSVHVYLRRGRRRSVDLRRNRFQFSNRRATWKLKHDSTPCKLSTCDPRTSSSILDTFSEALSIAMYRADSFRAHTQLLPHKPPKNCPLSKLRSEIVPGQLTPGRSQHSAN